MPTNPRKHVGRRKGMRHYTGELKKRRRLIINGNIKGPPNLDGKLVHLKPIVVLERMPVEKAVPLITAKCHRRGRDLNDESNVIAKCAKLEDGGSSAVSFDKSVLRSPAKAILTKPVKPADRPIVKPVKPAKRSERDELAERPHECLQCGERFHTNILLAVHKRIHDRESPVSETERPDVDDNDDSDVDVDVVTVPPSPRQPGRQVATVANSRVTEESKAQARPANPRYYCRECPASFTKRWYVDLHVTLLHNIHDGNTPLHCHCPGCNHVCKAEQLLREHITQDHAADKTAMDGDISESLGMLTSALTGERYSLDEFASKNASAASDKKKVQFVERREVLMPPQPRVSRLAAIEAELRRIVQERYRLGDSFNSADIQRWALEVCEELGIMPFTRGAPSKVWARRLLVNLGLDHKNMRRKLLQVNINYVYENAVALLLPKGLTEDTIFYACKGVLCDVDGSVLTKRESKSSGDCEDLSIDSSLTVVLSANASGSVFTQPAVVCKGHIVDPMKLSLALLLAPNRQYRNFLENYYFEDWFEQFVRSIPPTRPALLLVEGHVSQMSVRVIRRSRESDVHVVFMPCRKRFLHPHRFIREALLTPLRQTFDTMALQLLTSRGIRLSEFGPIFKSAWNAAARLIDVPKGFREAGFLPFGNKAVVRSEDPLDTTTHSAPTVPTAPTTATENQMSDVDRDVDRPWRCHWCADCGRGFRDLNEWTSHLCSDGPRESATLATGKEQKCVLCESEFVDQRELDQHSCAMYQSGGDCSMFRCRFCGLSFAMWSTLKAHLKKHEKSPLPLPSASSRVLSLTRSALDAVDKALSPRRKLRVVRVASSASISSASSSSSGTLTASSCDEQLNGDPLALPTDVDFKEEFKHEVGPNQQGFHRIPPPPPLPEHDYLGQIYSEPPRHSLDFKEVLIKEEPLEF